MQKVKILEEIHRNNKQRTAGHSQNQNSASSSDKTISSKFSTKQRVKSNRYTFIHLVQIDELYVLLMVFLNLDSHCTLSEW